MPDLQIGEIVSWTHVAGSGRTISMRVRQGVVEAINGETATVRMLYDQGRGKFKKGRQVTVPLAALTRQGEKTNLTKFVEAVATAARAGGLP